MLKDTLKALGFILALSTVFGLAIDFTLTSIATTFAMMLGGITIYLIFMLIAKAIGKLFN